MFLLDYLPPAGPGQQPLRPFERLPRRRVRRDRHGAGGGGGPRGWPCVRDTGPRPVPPACSGAPSAVASWLTKGTAWTRHKRAWRRKRCGRGCSPRSRPGPAPWRRPRPHGARQARANVPALNLPHQRVTRRARPEHECARRPEELAPPPPPKRLQGGGAQPKRLRYVKRAGRAQAALPALPAPPRGNRRARGGTRSTGVTRAGRLPGRTHTRGGGTTASPSPPPSRGLADIFGDISRWLTAARAGSSAKGEGIDPPPPPRGPRTPPPQGGGRSRGHRSTPSPIPQGAARRGRRRRPPQHRWSKTCPPPPLAVPGQPRQLLPPSPPQKRAQRVGGNEQGSHGALCKSCKGHRGVRHCCSRHHEGHPRVLGGGQRCLPVLGGGCSSNWALCPSEGRCARQLPRPGAGAGVQQGWGQQCCCAGARRSSSAVTGGPRRRAHNPRRTFFCRAATHRGARGGIGQATGRL